MGEGFIIIVSRKFQAARIKNEIEKEEIKHFVGDFGEICHALAATNFGLKKFFSQVLAAWSLDDLYHI